MILRFSYVLLFSRRKVRRVRDSDFSALRPHKVSARSPRRGGLCITSSLDARASGVAGLGDRARVGELEVGACLLEVTHDRVVHAGLTQHRVECA